jgi:hypothetical protein
MKYLKMLGLAAVAALACTALLGTGSASATVLCKEWKIPCPKGQDYEAGTRIEATLESGTTWVAKSTGGTVLSTCTGSTMEGPTTNTGGAFEPVTGNFDGVWFEGCTRATKVIVNGRFEIKYIGPNTFGGLTVKETQVTINTIFGSCVYGPGEGFFIGTITSAKGITPTIDVKVTLPRLSGPCPSEAVWEASYEITKPHELYFKKEMAP